MLLRLQMPFSSKQGLMLGGTGFRRAAASQHSPTMGVDLEQLPGLVFCPGAIPGLMLNVTCAGNEQ